MTAKHGENVKRSILETGLKLWAAGGEKAVTSRAIGAEIRLNHGSVLYHFGYSMISLRNAIAEQAVKTECIAVILQLISANHPAIKALSPAQLAKFRLMLVVSQAKP